MGTIRVLKYAQLGERKQRCWLCLFADASDPDAPGYAVAVRLNDFIGYWPNTHLVTSESWADQNLRRLPAWRPAAEAEAEFAQRLAAFPISARTIVVR